MQKILAERLKKGVVTAQIGPDPAGGIESAGTELRDLIRRRFKRSLHIRELDSGSCGACESEIIACNNPLYDLQRFGINFVASPRHADCLMVTGPVSRNMALALKRTYEAMPDPKFVITVGDCALNGGPFQGAYYIEAAVKELVGPVVLHIPGCPPCPEQIIGALLHFFRDR